jgi:hypothetical protein
VNCFSASLEVCVALNDQNVLQTLSI